MFDGESEMTKKKSMYGLSEEQILAMSSQEIIKIFKEKKEKWKNEQKREKEHQRYLAHADEQKARSKYWTKTHKREHAAYQATWRKNHVEEYAKYRKEWQQANPEKVQGHNIKWRKNHKVQDAAAHAAYYKKNAKQLNTRNKIWKEINAEQYTATRRAWAQKQYKENIQYKLRGALRHRLNAALRGNFKTGSAIRSLGCTIPELKTHLEKQFRPGMSWDNHGTKETDWHIDHLKDLALFDLRDPEQVKQACHYTNLRPLWRTENLSRPKHRSKTPKVA
jgi:hypothetical protein